MTNNTYAAIFSAAILGTACGSSGGANDAARTDAGVDTAKSDAPADAAADAAIPHDTAPDSVVLPAGATTPRGYLKATDSPFSGVDFAWFYLEDFEDHKLNTPGLTAPNSTLSSSFGAGLIDSVDEDDGNPGDGKCAKATGTCDALWGNGTLTFSFDPNLPGGLPTHAGLVWTDGAGKVGFEAFGPDGKVIYSVEPFSEPGFPDDTVNSSTKEDRFFGAVSPGGISAIRIFNTAGGVEADHVQYGRAR